MAITTESLLLFPSERANRFLTTGVLNTWYDALAIEAGVPRISSHGARHTAGSSYAIMGAGQKMIATMLGHADKAATERYTHARSDVDAGRAAMDEVARVIVRDSNNAFAKAQHGSKGYSSTPTRATTRSKIRDVG